MDSWKDQGQAVWASFAQWYKTGVTVIRNRATETAERWPRTREFIVNSCHSAQRATEHSLDAVRSAAASTDKCITNTMLVAVDYITIFSFLGIAVMFVVILCLPLMHGDPSALYPFLILVFVYLIFIWLPFYICVPEMLTNSLQEGQCKEKSLEDFPVDVTEPQVNLREVKAARVKSIMMRNKSKFAFVGAMLMFVGCLGLFPLTIVGGLVLVIPFYYWMIDSHPEAHQEVLTEYQVPTSSPAEVKPPEYNTLTPPADLYVTPPAYEDVVPCGEDTQLLLSSSNAAFSGVPLCSQQTSLNEPGSVRSESADCLTMTDQGSFQALVSAAFSGVPLCSVHQPSVKPHDSSQSTESQQTPRNEPASVRSESVDCLTRTDQGSLQALV